MRMAGPASISGQSVPPAKASAGKSVQPDGQAGQTALPRRSKPQWRYSIRAKASSFFGSQTVAARTGIEWADATANFWMGCTKLSPACDHCYAEADWDLRKHRVSWGPHGDRDEVKAGPIVCRSVQRTAKAFREKHGRKPRIFVNSLSDFGDNHKSIKREWRDRVWQAARECPDVILMILTKRPQNIPDYLPIDWGDGYPNVWIGTTTENQEEAKRRIPHLVQIPARRHFLSCEPLLGMLDLNFIVADSHGNIARAILFLDWIIAGGESGSKARYTRLEWVRSLLNQCDQAEIPFFFKQWGEWIPHDQLTGQDTSYKEHIQGLGMGELWVALGKKKTGRLIDGREYLGVPL